jgi:DNA adenine methylase
MKYVGSKARLSKELIPIIQKYIDDNNIKIYIEPFVGGANVIDKIKCEKRIGIDIDSLVIDLFQGYNKDLELPNLPTKEHYYDVRDNPNKYDKVYRSAILLFASYNARVYGGCYGAYAKTKNGTIRNYFQEAKRNFEKQLPLLKDIVFINGDYRELKTPTKCVIYCDPPYQSGIGYKQDFDHNEFWNWVREKSKNNIVLVSEYNAPKDFKVIWEQPIKTHMNNRNKLEKVERLFILDYNKQR